MSSGTKTCASSFLQDGEFIEVELVRWDGLLQHIQASGAAWFAAV